MHTQCSTLPSICNYFWLPEYLRESDFCSNWAGGKKEWSCRRKVLVQIHLQFLKFWSCNCSIQSKPKHKSFQSHNYLLRERILKNDNICALPFCGWVSFDVTISPFGPDCPISGIVLGDVFSPASSSLTTLPRGRWLLEVCRGDALLR